MDNKINTDNNDMKIMLSNPLMSTKLQVINGYDTSTKLIQDQKICWLFKQEDQKVGIINREIKSSKICK